MIQTGAAPATTRKGAPVAAMFANALNMVASLSAETLLDVLDECARRPLEDPVAEGRRLRRLAALREAL